MNSLRLVFVTRRYWPLVDGTQRVIADLTSELHRRGHQVTILTAQWEKHWPREIVHRDVRVVRLPNTRRSGWGTLRYMGALSRWIRREQGDIDLVHVAGMKYDAYSAIGALRKTRIPVVLRACECGFAGDCRWHQKARFGRRIQNRCRAADAIVAPDPSTGDELAAAGFDASRYHTIANGVAEIPPRDRNVYHAARQRLAKAHDVMALAADTAMAAYIGPFHESMGLMELVTGWRTIANRLPNVKLWLIGDGSFGPTLWQRVLDLDLNHHVIFPGSFDNITDVLQAADLFIQPARENESATAILEAMAAGVPIVAADSPQNCELLDGGNRGSLVLNFNSETLVESVLRMTDERDESLQRSDRARQYSSERRTIGQMADAHLQLFRDLIAAKSRS